MAILITLNWGICSWSATAGNACRCSWIPAALRCGGLLGSGQKDSKGLYNVMQYSMAIQLDKLAVESWECVDTHCFDLSEGCIHIISFNGPEVIAPVRHALQQMQRCGTEEFCHVETFKTRTDKASNCLEPANGHKSAADGSKKTEACRHDADSLMCHFVLLHQVGAVLFGGRLERELWQPHFSPLCEMVSFFLMHALD